MKKFAKKLLAITLAAMMVVPSFVFPSSAETTTPETITSTSGYSNIEIRVTTDKEPLSYKIGDTVTFTMKVYADNVHVSVPQIQYTLEGDGDATHAKVTKKGTLYPDENGVFTLTEDVIEIPGYMRITGAIYSADGTTKWAETPDDSRDYTLAAGIFVDYENVYPVASKPDDFDAVWDARLAELDAVAPKIVRIDKVSTYYSSSTLKTISSSASYDVYAVYVDCIGCEDDILLSDDLGNEAGATWAVAYITVPKNKTAGSMGISQGFQGRGINTATPSTSTSAITINMSTHSVVLLNNDNAASSADFKTKYTSYVKGGASYGTDAESNSSLETCYWANMLLRDVQMLRFAKQAFGTEGAASLVDENTVINGMTADELTSALEYWKGLYSGEISTSGGSQGGFQALCTAALEPEDVVSVNARIPSMADNYINTDANRVQCNTRPAAGEALRYVETSFLASRITAPVTITAGLNDKTCAPIGVMCIWNNIVKAHEGTDIKDSITFIQSQTHSYTPAYAENQSQTLYNYEIAESEEDEDPVPPAGIRNTNASFTASGYTDIDGISGASTGYVQIGTKTSAQATVADDFLPKLYYVNGANVYFNETTGKLVFVMGSKLTLAADTTVKDGKNQNVAGAVWYLVYWAKTNSASITDVEFRCTSTTGTLNYIGYLSACLTNVTSVKYDTKITTLTNCRSDAALLRSMASLTTAGHGSFASDGTFTSVSYTNNIVDLTGFTTIDTAASKGSSAQYALYGCSSVTNARVPVLAMHMFEGCTSLKSVIVANTDALNFIDLQLSSNNGAAAFSGCSALETITVTGSVSSDIAFASDAFKNTNAVTAVVQSESDQTTLEKALSAASISNVTVILAEEEAKQAENAVKAEGFSVRMESYTGLRALFSFDLATAANNEMNNLTLVSYGVFAASYNRFVNEYESDEDALFAAARAVTNNEGSPIKYVPVYNADGSGENKFVDYESRTFCISLTNIPYANALSDIYMAGYAVWVDQKGNESYTITTYDMADGEKAVNLYEITLGLTKTGVINSENTDDVCFWQTLKVGALRTKSFSTSYDADTEKAYTLPEDGYYTYLDVDWYAFTGNDSVDGYAFNPTGVSTTASGVVWSVLKYTDDEYVLILRNKDKSTYTELTIPQYTTSAKYNLFAPFHYKYGDDTKIGSATLVNYNPALTRADFQKIKVAVVDHGITSAAASAFTGLTSAHTIVYPNGFTLGKDQNYLFKGCTALTDVIWCHTDEDGKPIEHLSEFDGLSSLVDLRGVKAINLVSVVSGCTAVENILFPSTSSQSYVESIFNGCTALRRAWFDGLSMPADGTIDLTTITLSRVGKETFNVGSNIKTIKLPDATKEIRTSDYTILGVNLTVDYICSGSVATLLVEYVEYIRANGTSGTTANYCDSIKINGKSVIGIINGDYDVPDEVTVPTSGLQIDAAPMAYEVMIDPEKMPSTMEAWIKAEDGTARLTVFGNYIWSGLKSLSLEINKTVPTVLFGDTSASSVSFSSSKITLNTWVHIALTIDTEAKEFRFYINGELSETKTMSDEQLTAINNIEFTGNSGHLCLGSAYTWNSTMTRPFKGQIASFCAYSDVRTAEEVAVDYKKLENPEKDDLVLCYRFDVDGLPVYEDLSASKSNLSWKAETYLTLDELDIPEDYEYSLMVIGDTQTLVNDDEVEPYYALYDWLANNIESKKIQAIIGVGDITHNNIIAEWEKAKVAFAKLADKVVKHFPVLGNHDVLTQPYESDLREEGVESDPDNYKSYLVFEQDENNGSFDGTMKSYYYRFEMGGQKFLFLGMGYVPTQEELDWAKGVLEEHSDYNVILSCHGYLDNDGSLLEKAGAPSLREQLVLPYSNIVLVLCGHMHNSNVLLHSETREDGTTVQAVLTNPQEYYTKAGVGVATGLYFTNGGKTVYVANHLVGTNACLGEDSVRTFELDLVQNREE